MSNKKNTTRVKVSAGMEMRNKSSVRENAAQLSQANLHLINLKKGFNAKLEPGPCIQTRTHIHIFAQIHTLQELITPTTFHCAIHLNQLAHQRQYILPSISLSFSGRSD